MGRIESICAYIGESLSFADVGCDHGYCTLHALESGKCGKAVISDVSAKSLQKAEKLLSRYIAQGRCRSVCCDGLEDIPADTEQVLIAGMGGMEIIKILTQGFIPERFIFQPMKNVAELRKFLLDSGCKIVADDLFFDGAYYFIIKGERVGGSQSYTERQLAFGRDSLLNPLLKEYAATELQKKKTYLASCPEGSAGKLRRDIAMLEEVLNG